VEKKSLFIYLFRFFKNNKTFERGEKESAKEPVRSIGDEEKAAPRQSGSNAPPRSWALDKQILPRLPQIQNELSNFSP